VTVSVRFGSGFRIILIVIALGALFGAGVASAASPTEISSCTTLNDSGVYELVDSQTTSDSCISINASDVVFDGNGHQIGGGDPAIHVMPGVSNVTVRNVTVYSSYDGVYVEEATDVTIEDVTTRGNYRGIQIEDSSDVTIRTVDHQYDEYYGIRAEESQNVSVEGVTTSLSSGEGFGSAVIYFDSSNGSIVESDLTAGEYGQGIELRYSHQTVLDNVTANATDDYYTLEVYRSDDVVVRNSAFGGSPDEDTVYIDDSPNIQLLNTSIDDGDIGLYISGSPNATMREVSIDNSTYGLYISGDYRHDIDTSNTVDGLPTYYLVDESDLLIENLDGGYFGVVDSSNVTLSGVSATGRGQGFLAARVDGLRIESSEFHDDYIGLAVYNSTAVEITNITVSNFQASGISIFETPNVVIDGVSVTGSGSNDWGVRPVSSPGMVVRDSTFEDMQIRPSESDGLHAENNTFTSAKVVSYRSSDLVVRGNTFESGIAGVSLNDFSPRGLIENNTIDQSASGIGVLSSSDTVVRNNEIRNVASNGNPDGISVRNSGGVVVQNNTIDSVQQYGIVLYQTQGTIIENNTVTHTDSGLTVLTNGNSYTSGFVIRNNIFDGASRGLSLSQYAKDGVIEDNVIANISSYGVYLQGRLYSTVSSNITVSNNEFRRINTVGIKLNDAEEYLVGNNTFEGQSPFTAVFVNEGSHVDVVNNSIQNGSILITDAATVDVGTNIVKRGDITIDSITSTDVRSNRLESSNDGITITNADANTSVRENQILNATRYGIWGDSSGGTSEGAITGNEIRWSGGIGIRTGSTFSGTLTVADNIVVEGEDVGIEIGDNGIILRNNTVADNDGGIEVSGNAVDESGEGTLVAANHVTGSSNGSGIMIRRGDTGSIEDNVLDDNQFGITLISTHDFTVTNNTVSNSTVGLWLGRTFSDIQQRVDGGYRYSWFRETADNRATNNSFVDVVQGVHVSVSPDAVLSEEEGLSLRTETEIGLTGISARISVEEGDEDIITDVVDGPSVINTTVYNNRFVADDVFVQSKGFDSVSQLLYDPVLSPNTWNTTKTTGENIIGGPHLGGNYWSTPNGTGFSDTCVDDGGDGLCDDPYVLSGPNNTDGLPLADPPSGNDTDGESGDGSDDGNDGDSGVGQITNGVTVNAITVVNGTDPGVSPYVEAEIDSQPLLQLNLRSSEFGEYDLDSLGFDNTTEFEIDLTVTGFEPRLLIGAGNVTSWDRTPNGTNTTDITIRVRPVPTQALFECDGNGTCTTPDLNNWPTGANDTATDQTNVTVSMAVDDLSGYDSDQQTLLDGTIIGTDAQLFGDPTYRAATTSRPAQLTLLVGAPHSTVDGAQNTGFYDAFLPAALLADWGVSDPGQLSAAYQGSTTGFEATNVSGGMTIHVPLHYSAGEVVVSATRDTEPPTVTFTDLTGSQTDGGTVYANDTLTIEATANGTPGTAESVIFVLDSTATSFREKITATRNETTGNWTATVDLTTITDDGRYNLKAVAVDAAGNSNTTTAPQTVDVDRKQPQLGATITRVDSTNGRVNVTATESLQESTLNVTIERPDGSTELVTMTADGTRRWTGTFTMSSDGRYNVSTMAIDPAGNRGTDTAYANVSTVSTTNQTIMLKFEPSGMFIRFNTSADINSFVTVTTSNSPLAPLSPGVSGVDFLNGQLGEVLDTNLSNATIGVPVDGSNLPVGLTTDDYQLGYYNESADEWEFLSTEIRTVTLPDGTTDTYWLTQVDHFSTYGVVSNDTDAPTITGTNPSQNHEFSAGTTDATLKLTYEDSISGVNASAVTVRFDGQDVTSADSTQITSREVVYEASGLTNGSAYNLVVTATDEAGNTVTKTLSISVAAAPSPTTISSPSAGSSSSGGSRPTAPSSVTITPTNGRFEVAVTDAKANTPVEISFDESALDTRGSGLEMLRLTLGVDRAFDLLVSQSEGPEANGPSLPEMIGRSVSYLRLDHPELSDEEITGASFRFRVGADLLAERGATSDDVVLYRYHDGEWTALETTLVESTGSAYVFEADSPGLSTFAIATQPSEGADNDMDETPDGTQTEEQDGDGTPRSVLLVVVVLVAVLAIGGYLRTRR